MVTENEIQCPHCKVIHADYWKYIEPADEEGEFEMKCESCGMKLYVKFYTKIIFSTTIVEKGNQNE